MLAYFLSLYSILLIHKIHGSDTKKLSFNHRDMHEAAEQVKPCGRRVTPRLGSIAVIATSGKVSVPQLKRAVPKIMQAV